MRYLLSLICLFLSLSAFSDGDKELDAVEQLQWRNRILMLWSDNPEAHYKVLLENFRPQIEDRDMILFVLNESRLSTNYAGKMSPEFLQNLKKRFPLEQGAYYLVGKDGGVKARGTDLDISDIFDQIDLMPMRRQEMEKQ